MFELLKKIQFKNDKRLLVFAIVLVVASGVGVWHGDVTVKEAGAFLLAAFALPGFFGTKQPDEKTDDDDAPPTPKSPPFIGGVLLFVVALGLMPTVLACSHFTRKNAKSALDAIQITCVMSSFLTDEKAIAQACEVAEDLLPVLRDLISTRDAARRSGVVWHGSPADAGSDGAP